MRVEELVGRRIRAERERLGITQELLGEYLAEHLGRAWSRQAVSAAERGDRAFTAAELLAIALALNISVGGLLMPPADVREIEMSNGTVLDREIVVSAVLPRLGNEKTFEMMQTTIGQLADVTEQYRKMGVFIAKLSDDLNSALFLARGLDEARDRFGEAD